MVLAACWLWHVGTLIDNVLHVGLSDISYNKATTYHTTADRATSSEVARFRKELPCMSPTA